MVSVGSSTLGVYNPIFYAQEALIQLEKALGMASRVHRGFDAERKSFGKGDTINIRKPQTFTASNAPATKQGLETDTVAISLDNWKEVKFGLTDKELAFSGQRIIEDHIRPATYALADDIDQALVALYKDAGNATAWGTSSATTNITNARKAMFDARNPLEAGRMHMMMSGEMERLCLADSAFTQWQGAGDAGVASQMRGSLGTKYGYEIFANQNANGAVSGDNTYLQHGTHADNAGATTSAYAKGATSVAVDGFAGVETVLDNEPVKFRMDDGSDFFTTLTADVTLSAGAGTFAINDALPSALADNSAVTLLGTGGGSAVENGLAFHRNAFALAMGQLPEMGNELGARVATVSDPITGLSVRSRVYYVGDSSEVHVALDCLYGVKTLDSNLACRLERTV